MFNATPAACLVVSPAFTIVAVSDAHLAATGARREDIVGRNIFDAFPDNPDEPGATGVANVRAAILRVLQTRAADVMPILRYDVANPALPGAEFSEKYWKPTHSPIFDARGEVQYVMQYVEDVTEQFRNVAEADQMRSEISAQARQIRDQQHVTELFQQAPAFMAILAGPDHRVEFVNPGYRKLIGHRDIVGMTIAEGLPDAAAQGYVKLLDAVYQGGTPFTADGAKYAVQATPGGAVDERYVDFVFQPVRDAAGAVSGILVQGVDVTGRVLAEARRDALVRLNDVVRNLKTPDEIIFQACTILGETLGVSRVGYGTINADAETLTVERDWNAPGVDTVAGTMNMRDYGSYIDDLKLGKVVAIADVANDERTRESLAALKARHAGALVNVPVTEHGKLVALMFLNSSEARSWPAEELALIQEIAERTRSASERSRSELAVRLSEAKFRTMTDAMPQMVWSTLPDGFHDYYNQQWYDFTGLPHGSTDGDAWNDVFHPDDQHHAWQRWRHSLATGDIYEIQYRLRHHTGQYRWVLGRALPVEDESGVIVRWMGTCTDIHAQKLSEDEWRESSQRKDEFLAMLAHELRNPLAPISTAAQLLKIQGADPKRIAQASEIISRQVKHMTNLVDDLLDVSRVTRGLVELANDDLDLKAIVQGAIEQARPLLEARHHELVLRIPSAQTHVRGDKTRLVQAISNVLNNAAKYTPPRGTIALALDVDQQQVRISVSDDGIGMAPELLPRVFDLFAQAERTPDRAQGGLGLGLALVKSIALLHGGTATADSAGAGKGSTFTIILPRSTPEQRRELAPAAEPLAKAPIALRLMIVDDNQDAAFALGALLEATGHQVLVFDDAESALKAAGEADTQAFILDIGLPDMDGYQLARHLRANPRTAGTVLIALTGYGQAHDRVLSKAAGFDHHFVKPVDSAELAHVLANIAPGRS
nr:PAS domain-containing protein [Massilia soli]